LLSLSSNWNSEGASAYPTYDNSDPAFLIKNDIDMGELTSSNWKSIGTLGKPFEATFYGDKHTITAHFNGVRGLFDYTSYAKIQDFTLNLIASDWSWGMLAGTVDHGTFKNIELTGRWNVTLYNGYGYAAFYDVTGAHLDNIKVNLEITSTINGEYGISAFLRNSVSSNLNHISINGSYKLLSSDGSGDEYTNFYVFARTSTNDKYNDCEVNMELNISSGQRKNSAFLFKDLEGNTQINRLHVKNFAITKTKYDHGCFIDRTYDCTDCIISNLEDNTIYSNADNTWFIYNSNNVKIVNSIINPNYNISSVYNIEASQYINDIFTKQDSLSETPKLVQDVYFESDVENNLVTPELMNKNLADKKKNIPAGTYLPWYKDNKGRFHLKFNAAENEMYVIP
jgi:hypothetical protein